MADLSGKAALVTGGSRGIGAAIAKRLAADGATVALTYGGNKAAADATVAAIEAAGGTAFAFQADAADAPAVRAAINEAAAALGGLDILVHNAGVAAIEPLEASTEDSFRRQFGVNVEGVYVGTKAALGHIRDNGRILIVGSINGHSALIPGTGIYGATKAAVGGLARGWARDLGARGITVNVIQPGPIDTDMNPADGELAKQFTARIPIGRYGRSEEVAALAAFLASDEAGFITGAGIDIDGGLAA